jgi:integrase
LGDRAELPQRGKSSTWRGHLDKLLPARSEVHKVKHHPALPYNEMVDFITALQNQEGVAARALELLILTAARTGEVINAPWIEVDLEEKLWVVSAARMKAGREHRVPLSVAAMAVLEPMKEIREGKFVFAGGTHGKPLSNMAMLAMLKRMGRGDLTCDGFRSTFRDWAAERTNSPREVVEMALAHTIESKVEAAYWRGARSERY